MHSLDVFSTHEAYRCAVPTPSSHIYIIYIRNDKGFLFHVVLVTHT